MNLKKSCNILLLLSFTIVFSFTSCTNELIEPLKYSEVKHELQVTSAALDKFDYQGETQTIEIDSRKIIQNFVNDVYQTNQDEISTADFSFLLEGDDGFSATIENSTIIVTASPNEGGERNAELVIYLIDKPYYSVIIELIQEASPIFSVFELSISPEELTPFSAAGGSQDITILALEKQMEHRGDSIVEVEVNDAAYIIDFEGGEVFTYTKDQNVITITVPTNESGY